MGIEGQSGNQEGREYIEKADAYSNVMEFRDTVERLTETSTEYEPPVFEFPDGVIVIVQRGQVDLENSWEVLVTEPIHPKASVISLKRYTSLPIGDYQEELITVHHGLATRDPNGKIKIIPESLSNVPGLYTEVDHQELMDRLDTTTIFDDVDSFKELATKILELTESDKKVVRTFDDLEVEVKEETEEAFGAETFVIEVRKQLEDNCGIVTAHVFHFEIMEDKVTVDDYILRKTKKGEFLEERTIRDNDFYTAEDDQLLWGVLQVVRNPAEGFPNVAKQ